MLLLLSLFFCYAQQPQQYFTKISMTELWNSIDWSFTLLEKEQAYTQNRLIELENQLEQSERAYQDREAVLQNLENSLMKSEKDTKKWKTFSAVLGVSLTLTTITSIGIAIWALNREK